jgi:hypothetical protein
MIPTITFSGKTTEYRSPTVSAVILATVALGVIISTLATHRLSLYQGGPTLKERQKAVTTIRNSQIQLKNLQILNQKRDEFMKLTGAPEVCRTLSLIGNLVKIVLPNSWQE